MPSDLWYRVKRMRDFVNERSTGFAALIVASLLMVGWMRSQIYVDEIFAEVNCSRVFEDSYLYRSSANSIRFIRREWSINSVREFELLSVHYATITLPLGILSAVLILGARAQRE